MLRITFSGLAAVWLALGASAVPTNSGSSSPVVSCSSSASYSSWRSNSTARPPSAGTLINHAKSTICSSDSYTTVVGDNGTWPYREYKTTNWTSPVFNVTRNGELLAPGLIFLTLTNLDILGYSGLKQQGAVIMTVDGDLVWGGPQGDTSNFRKQVLDNKPVITSWIGSGSAAAGGGAAHGYGRVDIWDQNYGVVHSVCPTAESLDLQLPPNTSASCVADIHEQYITDNNTILVTAYNITQADLSSLGGPVDGYLTTSVAAEVDIETNEVLWVWNPQDHVPLNASHNPLDGSGYNTSDTWDWFHMNSIQSYNGGYLINSRQTWTSYFVNRQGKIEWQLNGETGGDFGPLPTGYEFSWEHHARLQKYGEDDDKLLYTNFNDANGDLATHNASNGISLILDVNNMSLQPDALLNDTCQALVAFAEGSHQVLDNGNHLTGYGIKPFLKEFGPGSGLDTTVRWSAQFAYDNLNNTASSYRALKYDWHATPSAAPAVLVEKASANDTLSSCAGGSNLRGFISWNGATDVTHYRLYVGSSADSLTPMGTFQREGFETEFVVPSTAAYIKVGGIVGGQETGMSAVVQM